MPATYNPTGLAGPGGFALPGDSDLANLAIEYIGFRYVWAGKPANGVADCSSFVNMLRGWFQKKSIPGFPAGTYDGTQHGPNTVAWLLWNGCDRVPGGIKNARPGDLAIWQTHMGVIVKAGATAQEAQMVSDLNPSLGTQQTSVAGAAPGLEVLFVERFKS